LNNKKRITVRAASKLLANTVSQYKGKGLSMASPLFNPTPSPPKRIEVFWIGCTLVPQD
jgi:hypothetical protein